MLAGLRRIEDRQLLHGYSALATDLSPHLPEHYNMKVKTIQPLKQL